MAMRFLEKSKTQAPVPPTPTPKATNGKKFCPQCGAQLEISDKFCPNCGKKL